MNMQYYALKIYSMKKYNIGDKITFDNRTALKHHLMQMEGIIQIKARDGFFVKTEHETTFVAFEDVINMDENWVLLHKAKEELRDKAMRAACKLCPSSSQCSLSGKYNKPYLFCNILNNFRKEISDND